MHSLIQWPRAKYWDKCWNPMLGCKLISPACAYCYAKFLTKQRFKHSFVPHETGKLNPPRMAFRCRRIPLAVGDARPYGIVIGACSKPRHPEWGEPNYPHYAISFDEIVARGTYADVKAELRKWNGQ